MSLDQTKRNLFIVAFDHILKNCPLLNHYAVGDASKASAEKGEKIMKAWVDTVVDVIRKVKRDDVVEKIMAKFRNLPR
jgi:hypothetical protein